MLDSIFDSIFESMFYFTFGSIVDSMFDSTFDSVFNSIIDSSVELPAPAVPGKTDLLAFRRVETPITRMAIDQQNTAQRIHKDAAAPPERVGSHFFETSSELSPSAINGKRPAEHRSARQ